MTSFGHALQDPLSAQGTVSATMENAIERPAERRRPEAPHVQLLVLGAAFVLAAGVVGWLLLRDQPHPRPVRAPISGPAVVSQGQLERFAARVDHPVYWAGAKHGFSYELTSTPAGRIFVRYLPQGVKAGDPRPDFLVVGTYAGPSSFADLKRAAKQGGSISVGVENGGIAVFASKKATSVYVGYPDAKYQIEVFAPSPETARRLVLAGAVKPVR